LTILGVNAPKSYDLRVHKIVKGGNHAGQRSQKSAFGGGAIFCIVRLESLKPVSPVGRSMLKVAPLREALTQNSAINIEAPRILQRFPAQLALSIQSGTGSG